MAMGRKQDMDSKGRMTINVPSVDHKKWWYCWFAYHKKNNFYNNDSVDNELGRGGFEKLEKQSFLIDIHDAV